MPTPTLQLLYNPGEYIPYPIAPEGVPTVVDTATIEDLSPEVKSLIDRTDKQISEREKQEYYRRTGRDQFGRLMGEQPLQSEDHLFAGALIGGSGIKQGIKFLARHPFLRFSLDTIGTVDGARNTFSNNGIRKTIRLIKEGDTWGALKSGAGDIFNIASFGDLYFGGKAAIRHLGNLAETSNAKWLDRPVPFFQSALDRSFPKSERDRIFRDAHFYNESQKAHIGLDHNIIPIESDINYTVPSIRRQILNTLGKTKSATGELTAKAIHSGKDVTFFLEGFRPFSRKNKPKHIAAHEVRHDIQDTFSGTSLPKEEYGLYSLKPKSQMRISDYVRKLTDSQQEALSQSDYIIYHLTQGNTNPKLRDVAKKLYESSPKGTWFKSLNEFDAELAFYREVYGHNVSWDRMPPDIKSKIMTDMAKRFGISEELVDEIATTLAINGYSQGGKL